VHLILLGVNQLALNIQILSCVKIKKMRLDKSFYFLRPRLLNIFLTILVLCLPLLREQYNQGQYVAWYRPIVVMADYLKEPKQPEILLIMFLFLLLVYFVASLAVFVVSKFALPLLKNLSNKS